MKTIEIDDELYQYIAGQTQHIGESASSILRRLLAIDGIEKKSILSDGENEFSKLTTLLNSEIFLDEKKLVNRFLLILSSLYLCNNHLFAIAANSLHGSKRRYLARDEQSLLETGNNTKPKQIPNSPYFVVTNSNTARKIFIMQSLMNHMEVPQQIVEQVSSQFIKK